MTTTLVRAGRTRCYCDLPAVTRPHGEVVRCNSCSQHWRLSTLGGARSLWMGSPEWLPMSSLGVWWLRRRLARKDGKR